MKIKTVVTNALLRLRYHNLSIRDSLKYVFNNNSSGGGYTVWYTAGPEWCLTTGDAEGEDGSTVQKWLDRSGNGFDLVQSDADLKPILRLDEASGKWSVEFDGVDDELDATFDIGVAEPWTWGWAGSTAANSVNDRRLIMCFPDGPNIDVLPEEGNVYVFYRGARAQSVATFSTAPQIIVATSDADGTAILRRDGVEIASANAGTHGSTSLRLGGVEGQQYQGNICSVVGVNRVLSGTPLLNLESLLRGTLLE